MLPAYSDHDPILLITEPTCLRHHRKTKIQCFEEKWVAHANCEEWIRTSWAQSQPVGSLMFCLFEKTKACRMDLVVWSRNTFGNTRDWLNSKQVEMEELMAVGFGENLDRIYEVQREINDLLHHEEVFWRQRSRSIWLPTGDKNTKYFHQRASQWRKKNTIEGMHDTNGVWCTNIREIANIVEAYYKGLFTTLTNLNMESVLASVDSVVIEEMARSLKHSYTEEVQVALFQMHPSKSPGPDDMSPFFFQKFWHIVGHDVTVVVLSLLHSGRYLQKMNYTHIVLIPKKKDPQYITEYCPISLGNIVSRIISKVLANRMKPILPNIKVLLCLVGLSQTTL